MRGTAVPGKRNRADVINRLFPGKDGLRNAQTVVLARFNHN